MSRDTVIFFLIICIIVLSLVVIFQHITFRRGIQEKLKQITLNLSEILDTDSDKKVMVFTDNKVLKVRYMVFWGRMAQVKQL